MNKSTVYYLVAFLLTIFLGIMSRKISSIPLFMGDLLYAVMIYWLVRILFVNKKAFQIAILSLLICYSIESFQLYQAPWIIELRKTLFGRYVLGSGFLWSDILAYTGGVAFAFIAEKIVLNYKTKKSEEKSSDLN